MVKASKGNGLKCLFLSCYLGQLEDIFANDGANFNLNAHCISDGKESRI